MKVLWTSILVCFVCVSPAWASSGELPESTPTLETQRPMGLWVQPLSLLTLTPFYASEGDTFLVLPLGAHWPMNSWADLAVELTPIYTRQDCEGDCRSEGLALSVGPMILSTKHGDGFFLQPKLMSVVVRDTRRAGIPTPIDEGSWVHVGGQVSLGLDVGYRKNFGPLFLSGVLGASVGRGWNVTDNSVFSALLDWPRRKGEDKWVWDLNVNLIRVGASF